jgi:hypothetical protein
MDQDREVITMGKGRRHQPEMNYSGNAELQKTEEERAKRATAMVAEEHGGPRRPRDNEEGHRPKRDQDRPTVRGGAGHGTGPKKDRK